MPRLRQSKTRYQDQVYSRSQLIADRWHGLGGVLDRPRAHPISSDFTGCRDGTVGHRLRGDFHFICWRVRDFTKVVPDRKSVV